MIGAMQQTLVKNPILPVSDGIVSI